MKWTLIMLMTLFSVTGFSASDEYGTNFSDDLDQNVTPASLEEREEELINTRDTMDENYVPADDEERVKQEEVESDVIQGDDPEKTYDPLDEEADE